MVKCIVCGKSLTNPESVARKMGATCYKKHVSKLIETGRMPGKRYCIICGKSLTNPESVARKMGATCYKKHVAGKSLPSGTKVCPKCKELLPLYAHYCSKCRCKV